MNSPGFDEELAKVGLTPTSSFDDLPPILGQAATLLSIVAEQVGPAMANDPRSLRVYVAMLRGYARLAEECAEQREKEQGNARAAGA